METILQNLTKSQLVLNIKFNIRALHEALREDRINKNEIYYCKYKISLMQDELENRKNPLVPRRISLRGFGGENHFYLLINTYEHEKEIW